MSIDASQLKLDYLKQSQDHISDFETAMLNYLETENSHYIDTCYKKIYILHRTAKAVELKEYASFYDQVEVMLNFIRSNTSKKFVELDFLVDLTDFINDIHNDLHTDKSLKLSEMTNLCKSFIDKNNRDKNNIDKNKKHSSHIMSDIAQYNFDSKHEKIYELSKELYTLNESLASSVNDQSQLHSLNYLSQSLLDLTHELNLESIKSLFDKIGKEIIFSSTQRLRINSFGESLKIEKKFHKALLKPLSELIVSVMRVTQSFDLMVHCSKVSEHTRINISFKSSDLKHTKELMNKLEVFEEIGISSNFNFSEEGLCLNLILDKNFDLLDAYVFHFNDSVYAIENKYICESVHLDSNNLLRLNNSGYYYLADGENIPVISTSLLEAEQVDISHAPTKGIVLKSANDKVVMPIDSFGSIQKVIKKQSHQIGFNHEIFKSVALLSDGKPAYVFDGFKLIENEKKRELKVRKLIECHISNTLFAFNTEDVVEVLSSELLSRSVSSSAHYGLLNHQGDTLEVHHPNILDLECDIKELTNILILKSCDKKIALLVGTDIRVKSFDSSEFYSGAAYNSIFNSSLIKDSYLQDSKEINVLDPNALELNKQLILKKVA